MSKLQRGVKGKPRVEHDRGWGWIARTRTGEEVVPGSFGHPGLSLAMSPDKLMYRSPPSERGSGFAAL